MPVPLELLVVVVLVRPAQQPPWPPAAMTTKAVGVAVVAEAIMLRHVAVVVVVLSEGELEVEVVVICRQTIAMIMTIVNIMHRRPRARHTDAVAVATMITHRHRRPSPRCCHTAAPPIVTRIMGSAPSGDAAASTRRSTSIDNTHAVGAAVRVAAAAATVADGIDTNGSGTREAAGIDTTINMTIETGKESGSARGNGREIGNANGTARENENDAIDRSR